MDLNWFRPEQGLVCSELLGRPLRLVEDEDEATKEVLAALLALLRFLGTNTDATRERHEAVVPAVCHELNVRFGGLLAADSPAFQAITVIQEHADNIASVALEIEQGVAWPRVRDPTNVWFPGKSEGSGQDMRRPT